MRVTGCPALMSVNVIREENDCRDENGTRVVKKAYWLVEAPDDAFLHTTHSHNQ